MPAHALAQRVEGLGFLRVQRVVTVFRPVLCGFEGRFAEQHRLCPVARRLAVYRELEDLLAVLVVRVAAARKHSCRALHGFLRLQAAERQQKAIKRLAQFLFQRHTACFLTLCGHDVVNVRDNGLDWQTRIARAEYRTERTGNKRNVGCNILRCFLYVVPCRFRLFRTEIILINAIFHHFAQQIKDIRQCVAGQAAYEVVHHLDRVECTARTG